MENKMKTRWDELTFPSTDSLAEISKHIQEILEHHPDAKLDYFDDGGGNCISDLEEISYSFEVMETDEEVAKRLIKESAERQKAQDLRLYNEIKTKYNL